MRRLVIIAVLAIVATTAAGIFEPQIKRTFGDCHNHQHTVHGVNYIAVDQLGTTSSTNNC